MRGDMEMQSEVKHFVGPGKYLLVYSIGDVIFSDTFDGEDVRAVHQGELNIIDISDPDSPKWYCSDTPVDPWVNVETA